MNRWFEQFPVAATMTDEELSQKMEEPITTSASTTQGPSQGRFTMDWLFGVPAWRHTDHSFGFIPPGASGPGSIRHVGEIEPDLSLKKARLRVSLDGLRVADYPGRGLHRILFNFYTQNRTVEGEEDVNFNATYRILEGESAAVMNYPIFIGITPLSNGLVIRCFTVNVKNDNDEGFLDLLESDSFKAGLRLATNAQPAITPLSDLAIGMTKLIAARNRNVPVQDVYLGLDFGSTATGARLALGSYVAVQMPGAFRRSWRWSDYSYDRSSGQILNDKGELLPLNYFVIGVNRSES
jgi:hypothetical protein